MASPYDTQLAKVYNSSAQKADMAQMLQPYMNWHSLLTAAPMSIGLLGNILLIAGRKDFSLEEAEPRSGFQCIKYPKSFRASLLQLVNESYFAMYESHTKMDQIRLYTLTVPSFLKSAVNILARGNKQQVEGMLPTHLNKIEECATNCKDLAIEVEQKYDSVQYLISELLEAADATSGHYNTKLEETKANMSVQQMKKERLEKQKEEDEEQKNKLDAEVREKQKDLKKAFDNQTSGFGLVAMGLIENVGKGLANALPMIAMSANPAGGAMAMGNSILSSSGAASGGAAVAGPEVDTIGLQKIQKLKSFTANLTNFVSQGSLNINEIMSEKNGAMMLKALIEDHGQGMDTGKGKQAMASDMCNTGVNICMELLDFAKNLAQNPEKSGELVAKVENFQNQMTGHKAMADMLLNSNPMTPPGPRQQMAQQQGGEKSAVASIVERDQANMETYKGLLDVATQRYDKAVEQQRQTNNAMTETLMKLQTLKINELNFDEIKTILRSAMQSLADLKVQWARLSLFFSSIANIIKVTLSTNLNSFKSVAEDQRKLMIQGLTYDDLMRDEMYTQAMQTNLMAHFVNHVATSYCEISEKHIMPQASALPRLSAMDPELDAAKIEMEKEKLTKECQVAQKAIEKLVTEDHKKFIANMDDRRTTVDRELGSLLAPPSTATITAIKDAVEAVGQQEKDIQFSPSNFDADNFV